jgi:catechol 2,3-dioxygenase-like lactoylglutathione lyase family enzyme
VPELLCSDFDRSLAFYRDVCGFHMRYERPEDRFAYLEREGAELMLEQLTDGPRSFLAGPLEQPFGRGMNLQIEVADVDQLHASVIAAGHRVLLSLEERWYRDGDHQLGNRQFIAVDPDGYLLRFFTGLGRRSI